MNDSSDRSDGKPLSRTVEEKLLPTSDDYTVYLERLSTAFMASARRWEMVVYPSLVAFIILSVYGFFLIYSLTNDAHVMARQMVEVTKKADAMSQNMVVMTQLMAEQQKSMNDMARSVSGINFTTYQMRQEVSVMNHSISRPLSVMNSFMPWGQ